MVTPRTQTWLLGFTISEPSLKQQHEADTQRYDSIYQFTLKEYQLFLVPFLTRYTTCLGEEVTAGSEILVWYTCHAKHIIICFDNVRSDIACRRI